MSVSSWMNIKECRNFRKKWTYGLLGPHFSGKLDYSEVDMAYLLLYSVPLNHSSCHYHCGGEILFETLTFSSRIGVDPSATSACLNSVVSILQKWGLHVIYGGCSISEVKIGNNSIIGHHRQPSITLANSIACCLVFSVVGLAAHWRCENGHKKFSRINH